MATLEQNLSKHGHAFKRELNPELYDELYGMDSALQEAQAKREPNKYRVTADNLKLPAEHERQVEIGPADDSPKEYASDEERQRLNKEANAPFDRYEKDKQAMAHAALFALGDILPAAATKLASNGAPRAAGLKMQELMEKVPINLKLITGGKNPLAMRVNDLKPTGTFVESADDLYPELGYSLERLENAYRQVIPYGKGNPLYMTEMQNLKGGVGTDLTEFGEEALPAILEGADVAGATAARSRLLKQIPMKNAMEMEAPYHPRYDWVKPKAGDDVLKYPTSPTRFDYPSYGKVRK